MTFDATSVVTAIDGRLANVANCWATRVSFDRVEIRMATQIDHPASSGVKQSCASRSGRRMSADATAGAAKSSTQAR
jgi:hypothetical protein